MAIAPVPCRAASRVPPAEIPPGFKCPQGAPKLVSPTTVSVQARASKCARLREAGRPAGSSEGEPQSGKHKARVPEDAGATEGSGGAHARRVTGGRAGAEQAGRGRGEEAKAGRGRPGIQPSPGRASTPRGRGQARRGRARGLGRRGRGAGESVPGPRPCFPLFLPPPTGRSCGAAPLAGPRSRRLLFPPTPARGEPVNPRTTRSSIWAMDG